MNSHCLPRRRSLQLIALAGSLCIAICYASSGWVLSSIADWLNVGAPLKERVDFCYVLGGGVGARSLVAAYAYQQGLVKQVLVSDPQPTPNQHSDIATEGELICAVLKQEQVPESAIVVLDGTAESTDSEVAALASFLQHKPGGSVAIVTHDYHTRRVRRAVARRFERDGLTEKWNVQLIAVPTDGFSATEWWRSEIGIHCYVLELAKTLRDWWPL